MTRFSPTLPLPFGEPLAPPTAHLDAQPVVHEHTVHPCLWLGLVLPDLPLEAVRRGAAGPFAILSEEGRQHRIGWCSDAAAAAGVQPGMAVNAALALLPGLDFAPRDRHREEGALQRLAACCLRLTPRISLDAGSAILLEVAGSLPLFGTLGQLCEAALCEARQLGHAVLLGVAHSARAALWLARAGGGVCTGDTASLPGALASLPLHTTGWPRATQQLLERMGVQRLGECLRLPREGLARRIGAACLADLDEALGRRPELRPGWHPPERYSVSLELPVESTETPLLMVALARLLAGLQAHLERRQGGACLLWVQLQHRRLPPTLLRIGLLRPSASALHLEGLAALHLSSVRLSAPVTAVLLEADTVELEPSLGADLLGALPDHSERLAALIERLRLRLGLQAVHGLVTRREHRPERAWQALPDPPLTGTSVREPAAPAVCHRPLWMLETPCLLARQGETPVFHGPLQLDTGPERIETGWWDGGDVRRDYYRATNPQGRRLWIFREHCSRSWYLHGLFG